MPDPIESPCQKICTLNPASRICTACHRTLEEIGLWSQLSPEARRAIMADLPARAARGG